MYVGMYICWYVYMLVCIYAGMYVCWYVYNYVTWIKLYNQREIDINSGPVSKKERKSKGINITNVKKVINIKKERKGVISVLN